MANKNLGEAVKVSAMLRKDCVFIETGGSVRRITLDDLMNSINQGDEQLLRQVAWGVPLKQNQSNPNWGRVGNLGMWEEYKSTGGRYLLTNSGQAAKLSPINSGVYADGTPLDESRGHIMSIRPKLYYHVVEDKQTGVPVLWMSQVPIGGKVLPETCLGVYPASMAGSALTSRSGQTIAGDKSITAFWQAAQVNGSNFGIANYDHVRKMAMFGLSQYGNPNIQQTLGNGLTGTGDSWSVASKVLTGGTKSLGDGFGKVDVKLEVPGVTGHCHVNLLDIENWYGLQWLMVMGVYFGNSGNQAQDGTEIFLYEGNRMPSSSELSTHPDGKFRQLTRLTSGGYVKEVIAGEHFDLFGKTLGGSNTTYWCDYNYNNNTGQLCLWGGSATHGARCGLVCSGSNHAFSDPRSICGARLAYFGPITYVDGKDIK